MTTVLEDTGQITKQVTIHDNMIRIIFATEQPLPDALAKLRNLVRDNVYV